MDSNLWTFVIASIFVPCLLCAVIGRWRGKKALRGVPAGAVVPLIAASCCCWVLYGIASHNGVGVIFAPSWLILALLLTQGKSALAAFVVLQIALSAFSYVVFFAYAPRLPDVPDRIRLDF